jgi:hypothetical protein
MQRAREMGDTWPRGREDHSDTDSEQLARNEQAWRQTFAATGTSVTPRIQRSLKAPTGASDGNVWPVLPRTDTEPLSQAPIYRVPGKPTEAPKKPIKTGKPARRSWRIGNPIFLVLALLLVLSILGVIGCDYLLSVYGGTALNSFILW